MEDNVFENTPFYKEEDYTEEDYTEEDDTEADREAEIETALKLMPGWFVSRMMTDDWHFGLMMSNGITIGIHTVNRVWQAADQTIWLDVELMTDNPFSTEVLIAPTSRTKASINASHVLLAFELADT